MTPVSPAPLAPLAVERLLTRVRKPGRYAGGEWNSVVKDWAAIPIRWCLAYPDLYEIGMSNLGLRILYEVLNEAPDRLAERCYAPDVDLQAELRSAGVPLWSIETRRSVRDFDVLGLSLGYELTFTNVIDMLNLAGIPLRSGDRTDADPLVIAGGTTTLNPEPMAAFVDAVVVGEGEDVVLEISDVLEHAGWHERARGGANGGAARPDILRALAGIGGVYVPSLYEPRYNDDGTFAELAALDEAAPPTVTRRIVRDFETTVRGVRQLVPNIDIVFDRAQIEVMRGCTRGCRFCQAGTQYRPVRERPAEVALEAAEAILNSTGWEEIGLTSLSTADYTHVNELATALRNRHPGITVSLPSTRIDAFTIDLADALEPAAGRRSSFTFAPEAGSQRVRDAVNKGVSDEEIERCAELAFERGWSSIKFYFMIGLPGETLEDVAGIAAICKRVLEIGRRYQGGRAHVKANVSTFVPKVATPFMWSGQDSDAEISAKVAVLQRGLRGRGLDLSWHDARDSLLEAAIGRGDRRVGPVIERAWRNGAHFDAWDEHFRFDAWLDAFAAENLDPVWYAQRDIPLDEALPWGHIDPGVTVESLRRDLRRAQAAKITQDCRSAPCYNCGVSEATGFDCKNGAQGPRRARAAEPVTEPSAGSV